MAEASWEPPKWLYNPLGAIFDNVFAQNQVNQDPQLAAQQQWQQNGAIGPFNPGATPYGDQAPVEYRATADGYNRLNDAIQYAHANGELTDSQYNSMQQRLNDHWTEPGVFAALEQEFNDTTRFNQNQAQVNAEKARYEGALAEGRGNLDKYEQEIGGQIRGDIARYQNVLGSGGLKSDAQYAEIMRNAENTLATQLQTVHGNIAKNMSDSGLRASGKGGGNAAYLADNAAFGKKAEIATGLMSDAQSRLTDAQSRLQGFGAGVMDMRNQLNAGYLPSMTSLTQYGQSQMQPSTFKTYGTGLDVGSQIYGQRLGERALNMQEQLGWGGILSNFISQQGQNMTQMMGMIRK